MPSPPPVPPATTSRPPSGLARYTRAVRASAAYTLPSAPASPPRTRPSVARVAGVSPSQDGTGALPSTVRISERIASAVTLVPSPVWSVRDRGS
jgi:hypothetical protein